MTQFSMKFEKPHKFIITSPAFEGHIRYWAPENFNVAYPGYDPPGVCVLGRPGELLRWNRPEAVTMLLGELTDPKLKALPPVWHRGPETMLKLETEDEQTTVSEQSETRVTFKIEKPGVFTWESDTQAMDGSIIVQATMTNRSSWDWYDGYAMVCCGLDPCPTFRDHTGERTIVFCEGRPVPYSQVRRRVWTDHRPTAQTLDPHGYSTPAHMMDLPIAIAASAPTGSRAA